ncbi:carbamoyltransferase HypF [Shewanella sp. 3_MG-2023]|uniref:carbamoyltransferase HypF n=1 Tax=Shewanella sp. 3_MG-2023 TaxID=3062635 RepID=UPI0026E1B2DF|nr:carbamoyltransferase HypF [Shewanella sp. 3_MG-2023]MDO6776412.1 carbamoyltransferase HypF [Shewanella sp. 3_MG-2023]
MGLHQAYLQQVKLNINGIVQGVGFRPYVYQLATQSNLLGSVLNNEQGVCIHLQGLNTDINHVIHQLRVNPPPLARIDKLNVVEERIDTRLADFSISQSQSNQQAIVSISADKSSCTDCLADIADPNNRHYQYPFTNCTNCGPRYSIVKQLPYDRHLTSMANFAMCDDCRKAYEDPLNRRYHAQPVSCPKCGPKLRFDMLTHGQITEVITDQQQVFSAIISALNNGKILAVKGLGGFHIICDATNDEAIKKLRSRKKRPAKPFAVMAANIEQAKQLVTGTKTEWQLLSSAEKPITLMAKHANIDNFISKLIAPDIDKLGLFLPYTPMHHLLLNAFNKPIVATSANLSGLPIITDANEIMSQLGHVIDGLVDHNRAIVNPCDDSVVQVINEQIQVIRLARGYAPLSIALPSAIKYPILGVGAQQKNTQCFAFKQHAFISPHIGDLYNLETNQLFEHTLNTFKRLYRFNPKKIISDKHPDYASSQWANNQHNVPISQVQHHHAHILSVLAINNYQKPVLGFSFDGTGLGDDDSLWGSECMLLDGINYRSVAHLKSFKLIGGEQAIKHPVRILLALLFEHFSLAQIKNLPIEAIQTMPAHTLDNLHRMWLNNSACIESRSIGRLFDAIAVALNLIETNQFEAQAGMLIETCANNWLKQSIASNTTNTANTEQQLLALSPELTAAASAVKVWDSSGLIKQVIGLITAKQPPSTEQLCFAFTASLSRAVADVANQYPEYALVFSGGVFQNKLLLTQCQQALKQRQILPSKLIPINDAGISLGQLWFAYLQQQTTQIAN